LPKRLQLRIHFEKKELPAYVFVVGKNTPTLRSAKVQTPDADGMMRGSATGVGHLEAWNRTMQGLAELLSYEMYGPVVDQTGIKGEYDVVLNWTLDAGADKGSDQPVAGSVAAALQQETGLIFEKAESFTGSAGCRSRREVAHRELGCPIRHGARDMGRAVAVWFPKHGQAIARLQQATGAAVSTLLKVMLDPGSPASVKVRAADSVLEHSAKGIELEDIEARLADLERHTEASKGH
jgi:hypothetical protein